MKRTIALMLAMMSAGTYISVSAWEGPFGVITNDGTIRKLEKENRKLREKAEEEEEGTEHEWSPGGVLDNDAKIDALRRDNKRLKRKISGQEKSKSENKDEEEDEMAKPKKKHKKNK